MQQRKFNCINIHKIETRKKTRDFFRIAWKVVIDVDLLSILDTPPGSSFHFCWQQTSNLLPW